MEYIVFDLEFNQGFDEKTNKTIPNERCPFEILQIGALKLDKDLNVIDTFNSYVKPKIYNRVHPFITNMTGIKNKMVKDAPYFPDVYKSFKKFIGRKDNVLCVWGSGDLKELYRNVYYYGLPHKTIPTLYINIQHYASAYFKNPSGKSIGLQNAIQLLEIEQKKSYHDGFHFTQKIDKNTGCRQRYHFTLAQIIDCFTQTKRPPGHCPGGSRSGPGVGKKTPARGRGRPRGGSTPGLALPGRGPRSSRRGRTRRPSGCCRG